MANGKNYEIVKSCITPQDLSRLDKSRSSDISKPAMVIIQQRKLYNLIIENT